MSLFPATEAAREAFSRLPVGEDVTIEIKRPRNVRHHRKFWALANLVHKNQNHYESVDMLVAALKVATGHCELAPGRDGTVVALPKSIAFHKMKQTEFEAFYTKCLEVVATRFLPGVDSDDLRREVEAFL